MKRREFLSYSTMVAGAGSLGLFPLVSCTDELKETSDFANAANSYKAHELKADIAIIGGGLGGCACAIAACRNGQEVILTEETDWIGGQVSQQGVPPDEHQWIETMGAPASYHLYRRKIRDYYKRNYPLTEEALKQEHLNLGNGGVSRICHEPIVSVAVLMEMLMPFITSGKLHLLLNHKAVKADVDGDNVKSIIVRDKEDGHEILLHASHFVDATECGDLLPMTGTEYVTGAEAKSDTGELHAAAVANPTNNQAFTVCFAAEYIPDEDWTIDKPTNYEYWRDFVPPTTPAWTGRLLDMTYPKPSTLKPNYATFIPDGSPVPNNRFNFWNYRKIIDHTNFLPGTYKGSITLINWPQNDYFFGNIIDVPEEEVQKHINKAKELNLALLYWLQTEAPRPDGGEGWKGLKLRPDMLGTTDGMAKYPYIRESRRIKSVFRILEEHVGKEQRKMVSGKDTAAEFYDSVGIGYYHIDLHPSSGGDNYIDFDSLPFQIPLGALLPQRMNNLFPACKNIGTTHITNGCYRLHPVEWSIGEAVGLLIAFARKEKLQPRQIHANKDKLADFQQFITLQGIETKWNF